LANRIAEFLPQSKTLPKDTRLTIAQIALAHRLDPFLGDIWAIPEKGKVNGEWAVTGYRIMIGISAWRRSAHDTGEYWGRRYEKVTAEERGWLGAGPNDLAIKCIVMRRKSGQQPMEFDGFGIFRAGESSKMNPLQCVRLRAERDALKSAFPIGFGGGAIKIGVADDAGEEINGESHGVVWSEPVATQEDMPQVETVEAESVAVTEQMPVPEPPAPVKSRPSFKKASVKFNGMTPEDWHGKIDAFAAQHQNWQKAGRTDPDHILISAAHAGYECVTGENIDQVLADIVMAHEKKGA
jgi:hypothetical protein